MGRVALEVVDRKLERTLLKQVERRKTKVMSAREKARRKRRTSTGLE